MRARTVLLVEDNEDDVFIFNRAFRAANLPVHIELATDGQQAWDYLSGKGPFANRDEHPMPDLVLLDLKLPYLNGFDVLERIRGSDFRDLPVAVLTSSLEERDRARAAELGAFAFLVKPPTADMLRNVIQGE